MIGEQLKTARIKKGFTQKQLADQLGYTTSQFVSNWEREASGPPIHASKKLSKVLGIPKNKYKEMLIDYYTKQVNEILK